MVPLKLFFFCVPLSERFVFPLSERFGMYFALVECNMHLRNVRSMPTV